MSHPTESRVPPILDRSFEVLTWLILAATPLLINVYNVDAYRTIQATFASILIALAVGLWAIARSIGRTWQPVGKVPMLWFLGAFILWTLITVPRSPSPFLGLASWWNLVLYFGFWIALADWTAREPKRRWWLLVPLLIGYLANSVIGLMQFQHIAFMEIGKFFPQTSTVLNYFAGLDAPSKLGSAAGMLGNQNVLGDYLIGAIPLCFLVGAAFLVNRQRWWMGAGLVLSGVLGTACLVATQTRGAYIGLGLGMGLALLVALVYYGPALRKLGPKGWAGIVVGLALLGGGLAWQGDSIGLNRAITKLHSVGTDNTSLQRINAWHVAKTMADEQVVMGQGLATYKILYFQYLVKTFKGAPIPENMHHRYVQAHNDFIQLAGETGYVGFALGLAILFGFAGGMIRWILMQRTVPVADRMLVLSGVAGLVSISGSAIFGFPYHIASSSVLAAVVAGLAGGLWTETRRSAAPAAEPAGYSDAQVAIYSYAMPVAIALVSFAVMWSVWSPYQADKLTKQGQELYKVGRIPEAQVALERAIQLDPERGEARLMMGLIYAVFNRFPDAEKELLEAERSYDDVTLHYYLGRVYESMSRPDKARSEYDRALHYFPAGLEITKAVSDRLHVLDTATK
ncbi:MAG TPA: O-antigen ligase family protein [Stenomitos sp.]